MIRLLHLADLHLGAPFGGFGRIAEERGQAVLEAVRQLPETAGAEEADAVLLAGDLFDHPQPPEATVAVVAEAVRRLEEQGIPVFAVPGNHDALPLNPLLWEDALRAGHVFRDPRFGAPARRDTREGPLFVYGIAYDPAEEPDPLATFQRLDEPGVHVALLHGSVPGAPHWEGGSALRLPLERLAALELDYIALGDHHRFRPPEAFSGVSACYSGSFAAVDLSETGAHGYVVAEVSPGRTPAVRLVPSGLPEVLDLGELDVSDRADEAEVADAVAAAVAAVAEEGIPVVRLTGSPPFLLDLERVRNALSERFGCAVVEDATAYYDSERFADLAEQPTVAGHVARLGLERIREAEDEDGRRLVEEGMRIALRALGVP